MIEARLKQQSADVQLFPKSTGIRIKLRGFEVVDHVTQPGSRLPFLAPNNHKILALGDKVPQSLLEIDLDLKPPKMEVELAVAVRTQPVLVNFSHVVVRHLQKFVNSISQGNEQILKELTQVTDLGLEEVQKRVCSFKKFRDFHKFIFFHQFCCFIIFLIFEIRLKPNSSTR